MNAADIVQPAHDRIADVRIHVYGIDHPHIREAVHQFGDCIADIFQFHSPGFPPVRSNQDDAAAVIRNAFRQRLVDGLHLGEYFHRVNNGVSRHRDLSRCNAFSKEVVPGNGRGSEVQLRYHSCQAAVHLFRIRVIDVTAA